MRTDDSRSTTAGAARLRDEARRAWRRFVGLGPRARLAASALAISAVVAVGYYAANPPGESSANATAWLFEGTGLAPEDARLALAALAGAKIPATTGPRGQIAVPEVRKNEALGVLAKQKLLPPTLRGLRNARANESILSFTGDRGERRDEDRQREVELIISELEGVETADVRVYRAATRTPGQRQAKLGAIVRIQPRDGRPLPPQTIQAIQSIMKSSEPDMPADALNILDRSGRPYLMAGNPEATAEMMAHVREEELRSAIASALSWIDGLRVHVALDPVVAAPASEPAPAVVVNAPTEAEPATTNAATPAPPIRARILVQVPISYYLGAFRAFHRREATLDELKDYVPRVEESIRATVMNFVPAQEVASLRIDRIDAPGPVPPPVSAETSRAIQLPPWLVPAAAGAVVAVFVLVLIGTRWMMAAKKPVAASATAAVPRAHFAFDTESESGPSGRVRDLVRRDPAAAAGVLGRWIGQGGPSS